jgi:hypothetical protein
VGWGNSSSKAFGISFAERPKAKRIGPLEIRRTSAQMSGGPPADIRQCNCALSHSNRESKQVGSDKLLAFLITAAKLAKLLH